jgi:Fe-S cluster assembly ATP-binding protein
LKSKNLYAGIEGKEILKGLSLTVPDGEVHAIMGRTARAKARYPMFWRGGRVMT